MSPDELAKAIGVYGDTDLPIEWAREAERLTSYNPYGHILWAYKDNEMRSIFGYPVAVTPTGRKIMGALANRITKDL